MYGEARQDAEWSFEAEFQPGRDRAPEELRIVCDACWHPAMKAKLIEVAKWLGWVLAAVQFVIAELG